LTPGLRCGIIADIIMRIALAIQSLVLARGGAERFTRNLIRGLTARGHGLVVFCHDWDDQAAASGIELVRVPPPRPWRHPWPEFSRNVWAAIGGMQAFDVVFGLTQLWPQDVHRFGGGVYRYWYRRKYGMLLPLQLLRPRIRGSLAFERAMYSPGNYRQLIAISDMDRRIVREQYGVPAERVHTVYNGFDQEEFHPHGRADARDRLCAAHGLDPQSTIVLFAANNYVRKGLPQAVEALRRAPQPGKFTLVAIGKPDRAVRRRLDVRIGAAFRTVWLDRVDTPAEYYRGADMLLFPTLYDSFANVIGEALLCGLPVITTRQAGGAEMVIHGENGFVARDADALRELTEYAVLLTDRGRCAAFSQRAPGNVAELTIARCGEATERVLQLAHEEKLRNKKH